MIWKTAIFIAGFLASFAHGADNNPLGNQLTHDPLHAIFKLLDIKSLYQLARTHSDFFKILEFMFRYMPFIERNKSITNRDCILHDSTIPMDLSFAFKFPIDENMRNRIIPIFQNLASNTYKNEDLKLEFIPEQDSFILSEIPAHRPQYYTASRVIDHEGKESYQTIWKPTRKFPLNSIFRFDLIAGKMTVEVNSQGRYDIQKDEASEWLELMNENGKMCFREGKVIYIILAISEDPSTSGNNLKNKFEKFNKNRFEEILDKKGQVYTILKTTKMYEINLKTSQSQEEMENSCLLMPSQFDNESFNRLTFAEGTRAHIIGLKKNIPLMEVHEYTAIDALQNIMNKMNRKLLRNFLYEFVIKAKEFKKLSNDKKDETTKEESTCYLTRYFDISEIQNQVKELDKENSKYFLNL